MDITHHRIPQIYFGDYGEEENLVEEIESDEYSEDSEYTMMTVADCEGLGTIAEETSLDLWTEGSSMLMPDIDDLDSTYSMESMRGELLFDHLYEKEGCNEIRDAYSIDSLSEIEFTNQVNDTHNHEVTGHGYSHHDSATTLNTVWSSFSASAPADPSTDIPDVGTQHQLSFVNIEFFRATECISVPSKECPTCADEGNNLSLKANSDKKKTKKNKKQKKKNKTKRKSNKSDKKQKTEKKNISNTGSMATSIDTSLDADMKHDLRRNRLLKKIQARIRSIDKALSKGRSSLSGEAAV